MLALCHIVILSGSGTVLNKITIVAIVGQYLPNTIHTLLLVLNVFSCSFRDALLLVIITVNVKMYAL